MGFNRGFNGGLTGSLVTMNIPGQDGGNVCTARIFTHGGSVTHDLINRTGRGSGGVTKYRLGDLKGGGYGKGKAQTSGPPAPTSIQYATGTITEQLTDGCSVTIPVRLTEIAWSQAEKTEDGWDVSFKWALDGEPAWDWNGTQITPDVPAANSQETYEGLAKVADNNGLTTSAVQRIDRQGVDDTDAAENAAIATIIGAASTPISGLKLVDTSMVRTDATGIVVLLKWGLVDSADAIQNPETKTVTDPLGLESSATRASVYTTGSPPSNPTVSGVTLRTYEDIKLNDTKSERVYAFGERTTKEDVEFPGSRINIDPADLSTNGEQTTVHNTGSTPADPAPPTHTKIVSHWTVALTSAGTPKSSTTWRFEPQTSQDKIQQDESYIATDPLGLKSEAKQTLVDATPDPPDGFVTRVTTTRDLSDWHSATSIEAGLRTTQEDIEFPETRTDTDPTDLTTTGQKVTVHSTASPPADPSPPTHTKIISKWTIQLTSAGTPKSYTAWRFAQQTPKDKIQQDETFTTTDASGLTSTAKATLVDATPSAPAGFVARTTTTRSLNDWHTASSIECGLRTTIEDKEFPDTYTNVDPEGIDTEGRKLTVHNTSSPPSDPTPPSGTKIVRKTTYQYTSAGTAKSYTVWDFATNDSADKIANASRSGRSAQSEYYDEVVSAIAASGTLASQADSLWGVFQSTTDAYEMELSPVTPAIRRVVYKYLKAGILIQGSTGGRVAHIIEARVSGGNVQLFVAENKVWGSKRRILLTPQKVPASTIRTFEITRTLLGSTIPDQASLIGKTNAASFLGLAIGTVLYCGASYKANYALVGGSNFPTRITYGFIYNPNGHFDALPETLFNRHIISSTASTTEGDWVDASTLALAFAPSKLSTGDFSPFIT